MLKNVNLCAIIQENKLLTNINLTLLKNKYEIVSKFLKKTKNTRLTLKPFCTFQFYFISLHTIHKVTSFINQTLHTHEKNYISFPDDTGSTVSTASECPVSGRLRHGAADFRFTTV